MAHPFPIPRTCPFSPPDEYVKLRAEAPVVRGRLPGGEAWLVTRHAEAQQVLTDETISSDPTKPGHPKFFLQSEPPPEAPPNRPGFFLDTDPPEHTRFRRLLIPEFSLRRIRAMRPDIRRTIDGLIDDMLARGDRADLVESFGLPVASLVVCELLGVPHKEREFFESRTRTYVTASADPARGSEAAAAMQEISAFLSELVTAATENPGDDMVGRLVASGEFSHVELVGMVLLLLMAGHETTASMLPLSVLTLLRHPEQLQQLKDNPELWPAAVEELLRYHSVVDWFPFDRVATQDIVVGGQEIKAGDAIFILSASANHDERVFERPGEFDIHRDSRHHIAFGHGLHQCIGQNLARAELEIALSTLFERLPNLRVEGDVEDVPAKYDAVVFGLKALPVTW